MAGPAARGAVGGHGPGDSSAEGWASGFGSQGTSGAEGRGSAPRARGARGGRPRGLGVPGARGPGRGGHNVGRGDSGLGARASCVRRLVSAAAGAPGPWGAGAAGSRGAGRFAVHAPSRGRTRRNGPALLVLLHAPRDLGHALVQPAHVHERHAQDRQERQTAPPGQAAAAAAEDPGPRGRGRRRYRVVVVVVASVPAAGPVVALLRRTRAPVAPPRPARERRRRPGERRGRGAGRGLSGAGKERGGRARPRAGDGRARGRGAWPSLPDLAPWLRPSRKAQAGGRKGGTLPSGVRALRGRGGVGSGRGERGPRARRVSPPLVCFIATPVALRCLPVQSEPIRVECVRGALKSGFLPLSTTVVLYPLARFLPPQTWT